MSNFLDRLAARTLGMAPLARPVVPTIFAPAESGFTAGPGSPVDSLRPSATVAEPSAALPPFNPPHDRSTALVQQRHEPQPLIKPAPGDHPQTQVDIAENGGNIASPQSLLPEPSPLPGGRLPAGSFLEQPRTESRSLEQAKPATEVLQPLLSGTKPVSVNARPRSAHSTADPVITAAGALPSGRRSFTHSEPQQSVIKVTIGRVDVRAEFPPASVPSGMPDSKSGGMSLEEYARQRNEGKR